MLAIEHDSRAPDKSIWLGARFRNQLVGRRVQQFGTRVLGLTLRSAGAGAGALIVYYVIKIVVPTP